MSYEIHEAALVFPLMEGKEFDALKEDIAERGLLEPIDLYEGKVLDGRNRVIACKELGIEPKIREADLNNGTSPVEFVIAKNLHRRHLTPAQRTVLALALMPRYSEEARQRQVEAGKRYGEKHPQEDSPPAGEPLTHKYEYRKAAKKAADAVNVGRSSVEAAIAIQKRDPHVIERMRAGELNVAQAAREVGLIGRGYGGGRPQTAGISNKKDKAGRNLPFIVYGKGDKWNEVIGPLIRYLSAWEKRGYEYTHLNPKEARRRLVLIEEIQFKLTAARLDLEQRAHQASLRVGG